MNDVVRLSDIANIRLGHPFRGRIEPDDDGSVHVVRVRDARVSGEIVKDEIIRTKLTTKKEPDWLQNGDVLFVAKGANHFAAVVKDVPKETVCSPHFYLIRLNPDLKDVLLPEFICWQLNQQVTKKYFRSNAEGSNYLSIRKQILEYAPIKPLPMARQKQIAALHAAAIKEEKVLMQLIENRKTQLEAIAFQELENF